MLRVGLIESNELLRSGRAMVITSQPDMQIVFEAENPKQAIEKIGDYLVDVLVVNIRQHGFHSSDFIHQLRNSLKAKGNDSAILAFTNYYSENLFQEALISGADDLVSMEIPAKEFISKIRQVAKPDYRVEVDVLERTFRGGELVSRRSLELGIRLGELDELQAKIIKAFQSGLGDAEIAKQFDVSRSRVEKLINSLIEAGSLQTRNQLALSLMRVI